MIYYVNVESSMSWSTEKLIPWQQEVDPLADAATQGIHPGPPQSLYEQVQHRAKNGHRGAELFVEQTRLNPEWCDEASFERGRAIVVEVGLELALVLTVGGLIEGYAAPTLVAPLLRTGKIRDASARRIFETGQVVHNARALGGLDPDGVGRKTILQVRVLHSVLRHHLESHGFVGPDGGRAIHQLDMAHTATAFSYKGVAKLPHLGITLNASEKRDVHHFWRVVHHLHGVDLALLPETHEENAVLAEFLDQWRFDLDFEAGAELARGSIASLAGLPPFFLPERAISTFARRCMSTEQANRWQLQNDALWNQIFSSFSFGNRGLRAASRYFSPIVNLRSRLSVAMYGYTLRNQLGIDPKKRTFDGVAGEESRFGPGLEPLRWFAR